MALPYVRVCLQGTLPGGEVWSINPAFIGNFTDPVISPANLQQWANSARTFIQTGIGQQLRGILSDAAAITNVRVVLYGEDGRIDQQADAPLSTPVQGTGTLRCPPTTALVLSLQSGLAGRSYRGRLYWPALSLPLDADTGRISSGPIPQLASDAVAMLAGLENAQPADRDTVLGIYSKVRGAGVAVSSVRIGNVPDSQRRRKDALTEDYTAVSYA